MDFKRHVRDHLLPLTIAREPEIVDELAQHLQDLYDEAIGSGLSHDDAVARALTALPDERAQLTRDLETASRLMPGLIVDRWQRADLETPPSHSARLTMLSDLHRDVRYGVRMLAAAPTFTAIIVITLALGVGANALIFTAIDAILLRSAGIADTGTLASVYNANTDGTARFATVSFPDYADLRDAGIYQDIAVYSGISLSLDTGAETESLVGELVTANYFRVLGTSPALGRTFVPDEDCRGTPAHVAVVSYRFWQNRLSGTAAAVGREIQLNGAPYTVIGVAPPRFVGATVGRAPEVWVPMALQQEVRPPTAGLRRALGGSDLSVSVGLDG